MTTHPLSELRPSAKPATARRIALIVVMVFVIAGALWILVTDLGLYWLIKDPAIVARVETAKG